MHNSQREHAKCPELHSCLTVPSHFLHMNTTSMCTYISRVLITCNFISPSFQFGNNFVCRIFPVSKSGVNFASLVVRWAPWWWPRQLRVEQFWQFTRFHFLLNALHINVRWPSTSTNQSYDRRSSTMNMSKMERNAECSHVVAMFDAMGSRLPMTLRVFDSFDKNSFGKRTLLIWM